LNIGFFSVVVLYALAVTFEVWFPFELLNVGFLSDVVVYAVEGAVAPGKGVLWLFTPVLLMNLGLFTPPWEVAVL